MDYSRSVDVQIVLCSHCQHVTSGTEREREERTQTRQIGLLSNQLGNLGKYGDTTRHLRSCGAGIRQQGREIIKTVLSDYLCNFRSEAVCECASILTLKAATLVIREHLWIYIPTKVRKRGSDEKNVNNY